MARAKRAQRDARNLQARAAAQRNGVAHTQLSDLQRARILAAMLDVSCERGAANVTVAHVVERSGVSRRTFYEQFTDREDCFLAAFEQALEYAAERVVPAYESEKGWRERMRAALSGFLSFLEAEPVIGRMLIVESFGGGPATMNRRNESIALITHAIDEGRGEAKASLTLPPLTAEGVVGGVLAVIHSRLVEGHEKALVELTSPLMSMIVLPYLGPAAARRELERPAPAPVASAGKTTLLADPFKAAGMRLTYRTVRVLMALAQHPGASNRVVADTAEIRDQGQISKLLARLQRAGMVTNTGLGPGQGAPNAWTLTESGRQVVDSVRAHTEGRREGAHEGARER